jgi:hypothetical protein
MISDTDLEVIAAAAAKQNEIDRASAGPKEPYDSVPYKGVSIASRYSVKHEFDEMRRAIDAMPELIARRVESIWCDSNACACYIVMLHTGRCTSTILDAVHATFVQAVGGWNGLVVYGDDGKSHDFDCYWPGEDAEFVN